MAAVVAVDTVAAGVVLARKLESAVELVLGTV